MPQRKITSLLFCVSPQRFVYQPKATLAQTKCRQDKERWEEEKVARKRKEEEDQMRLLEASNSSEEVDKEMVTKNNTKKR